MCRVFGLVTAWFVPILTITVTMEDDDGYPGVDRKSCELLGETALVRTPSCTSQYSKLLPLDCSSPDGRLRNMFTGI